MKRRNTLKWQMLRLMAIGWFVPLTAIVLLFLLVVSGRIDRQSERIITTSMEKAAEISILRLSDCIDASKDASYLPYIGDAWAEYQSSGDSGRLYNDVTNFLSAQYKYNPSFDITALIFVDEPDTIYYTGNTTGRGSVSRIRFFKDQVQGKAIELSEELDTRTEFFSMGGHVYMIRNLMGRGFKRYAVLIMELNPEEVFESIKSVWEYRGMSVSFEGQQLWSEGDVPETIDQAARNDEVVMKSIAGKEMVLCSKKSVDGSFNYAVSYDATAVNLEKRTITVTFCILLVFLIPLIFMVMYFFNRKITAPISELTDVSKQIADGNYGVTAKVREENGEITDLSRNFNKMSDKLSEQFNKIFVEEIALRDANIHALQSQINPHFLNNTLEIINWEARMHGEEKVSSMIEALSVMMSATMDRNRQSLITLEEEMEYVNAYLYIIECRYQERFTHEEIIDPALLSVRVPRLIIQPVIENAVEYGNTGDDRRQISLKIEGTRDGDKVDMKIMIINPGEPSEEDMAKIKELLTDDIDIRPMEERSTRIGIRNVNRRLKMIYGGESHLTIEPDGQGNTISTIFVKN
ncbi:HAMP domain-containing protein [Butyrivibrio sp. CB08]|uniref:sensor histidine kinase n=1 Tax=Butyrivibrio sp. CB08 TaxID=2364879 RepID=UPI000EA8CEB8|nr:histidine kinase [Butyrivibrio sp. CB08]RKM60601.1 HAMP domain-containing protein [Butyrivibrio sp. CB08]